MKRALLLPTALLLACPQPYDPPPDIDALNIDRGLYDPTTGPLQITFSEPVLLRSMTIALRLDRHTIEYDACVEKEDGSLPEGCAEAATAILGPCTLSGATADPDHRDPDTFKFNCDGGNITVSADQKIVTLEPNTTLTPYERYSIDVDAGLEDADGRVRGVGIREVFQVASNIACGPTTFESGMFFAIFDIEVPIPAQFHFFFWSEVNPDTGQLRAFGADADPHDEMTDTKLNRVPSDWFADTRAEGGAIVEATGQVATVDGDTVVVVFPFDLRVAVPPVLAPGAELNARVSRGEVAGTPAPMGDTDLIAGRLFGPKVFFGEGADQSDLGMGNGTVRMFRINDLSNIPSKPELLRRGVTVEDIEAPFPPCID